MQKYVIALYIRLSLEDYKYDSMSIENQHLVLNEFVSSMRESTDAEVLEFIDNGYSGTNFERPKVQELIELVRANQIDMHHCKRFFSVWAKQHRNRLLHRAGCSHYFTPGLSPSMTISDSDQHKGDTGGMDVAFKYLISEYYSRDMSMKTKSAKYAKMQRGEYQSKICPYGYRKSADGRMEPNPETAAVVQLIFSLRQPALGRPPLPGNCLSGASQPQGNIKPLMGSSTTMSHAPVAAGASSTVLRILEDERYIGSIRYWAAGSH